MILVHKPQSHFSTFPAGQTLTHRRHPSAPVPALVAVQPTRTPGLLSLSKPQIQAQQKPRSSPKLKHKSPQPAQAVATTLEPAQEIVEKQESAKVSQSPKKRGRQSTPGPKPKSAPRSASNRRQPTRQPSPPISSSQAEVPAILTTKPFFDSFSDESPLSRLPTRPTPKLAPKPSGKLASRRQQGTTAPISPPRAIPIPSRPQMPSLHKRASAPPDFAFPICDDISEVGDDGEGISPPVTPTQPKRSAGRHLFFDDGPKTAPITLPGSMPFRFSESPSPRPSARGSPASSKKPVRPRRHVRSPSEGVFQMSDEEVSTSSSSDSSGDLMAALGLSSSMRRAKFASSTFLNSPDPEALPPPSF